jgi:hypothetical protein
VAVAAGVAVGLNLLAETVTLSRIVDGVPPLRWLDRAGRVRATPELDAPAPPSEPAPEPAGTR